MKRPSSLLGLDITAANDGDGADESRQGFYFDSDDEEEEYGEEAAEYSDDDGLLRRAFYVKGELPPEAGPPQNGVDYLKHVKWEARRIPSTIVADVDPPRLCSERTVRTKYSSLIRASTMSTDCVDEAKPAPEWESHFLEKFTKLRNEIEERRTDKGKRTKKKRADFPQRDEWAEFCLVKHPVPSHSMLYDMDNVTVTELIDVLAEKLRESVDVVSENTLHRWLFCLLAHLEVPLVAETSASLRSILKHCTKLRSRLTKEECSLNPDQVARLNIMITICGRYFSQG